MTKILFLFLLLLSFSATSFAQVKVFDKLEMYYDQGHYAIVLKRSNKLLDNPEYDYSQIPSLYKSMALFQLSQNEYWFKRHPNSLEEAKDLFSKIKSSSDGKKVFEAHIFEIAALKRDLIAWSGDLKRTGQRQAFENIQEIMNGLFDNVPDVQYEKEIKTEDVIAEVSDKTESASSRKQREAIINAAKKYVGVPYVWAGNDPKGFDCSGFTSYVLKEVNKELPRRAKDQYESSIKVKDKNVEKGDLVFFDNGGGISHVGIIVSDKGKPLQMIHASSSKGIIITDIDNSAYWQKRIFGFGTYITE
ncbi:MAG: C40 family peptidase [Flavobacteriia bacterium]|jgi:cell wall-associated NlpC family hydrolase